MPSVDGRARGGDLTVDWSRPVSRRRFLWGAGLLGSGAALASVFGCRSDSGGPLTTLDRTIVLGMDGVLRPGPGEPYQVRTELAQAQVGREKRRGSLVVFHHFGDVQLLDEESPLRGEWQDSCPTPLSTAAFRPQEALTLQAVASLIRQANRINRSPLTKRSVDFALHTGNAADNAQYNELRWFIDLMDGKQGAPDSGGPGYEGVQPESPDQRYPDMLSLAQIPFQPQGISCPWYTALGNRDVLVQGNFPPSDASRQIALGGKKIIDLSPARKDEVCADPSILLDPERTQEILADKDIEVRDVTPDENRRLLTRADWIKEMFNSSERPGPQGHGLTQGNVDKGIAYYAFERGLLAFIVLDTVNPAGFAAGSIDAAQFAWLEGEMKARSRRSFDAAGKLVEADVEDRLIVVVSHHPLERLNNPLADPSGDGRVQGPALKELLHRFPNVIAHVTGGSPVNSITPRPDAQGRGGSYWEISTTSPTAYPTLGRLLEVVNNADGTVSLFSTVYDLGAPIDPRDAEDPTPGDGVNEAQLASVARAVAAEDPQRDPKAAGLAASHRNAELVVNAAFDLSSAQSRPALP